MPTQAAGKLSQDRSAPLLVRLPQAAEISGVPLGWLQKSFMEQPPKGAPPRPPHVRVGRAIYVIADRLPEWVASKEANQSPAPPIKRERGRPRKADAVTARRGR